MIPESAGSDRLVSRLVPRARLEARHRLQRARFQSAKAPLAAMKGGERVGKIGRPELRPHPLGEMQLGIGAFPQQEVREPLLAAGADDEVDVAQAGLAG